jgi:hypothetical protein
MARTLELDTITEPNNTGTANITLSTDSTTTFPKVDINSGAIDATTLGAASPSSVAATTLNASGNTAIVGNTTVGGTLSVTGITSLNVIDSGSITSGFGNIDIGSNNITTTGTGTITTLVATSATFTAGAISGITALSVSDTKINMTGYIIGTNGQGTRTASSNAPSGSGHLNGDIWYEITGP